MNIRPIDSDGVAQVRTAIESLRLAREAAKKANCPQLVEAIRKALKSAGGAERHALHRARRAAE